MCTTDIYTDVYPDGHKREYPQTTYCSARCANPIIYNHPPRVIQYGGEAASQFLYAQQGLPTPRQTPRTTTPVYHSSGNESDRSRRSSGSGSRKHRESGVYINGTKVLDLNRKRQPRGNERIVIVDNPPTARTPPKNISMPYTAPPSPNANQSIPYNIVPAAPRDPGLRPIIVDERPRVSIEVVNDAHNRKYGHHRHGSHSSHNSHNSHNSYSSNSDEEKKRRRRQEREDKMRAEDEIKRQKMQARINAANEEIHRRPAIPLKRTSTNTYIRPKVEIEAPESKHKSDRRSRDLTDSMRHMNLGSRERREREAQEEEEEAQRLRLMERMMPKRRATVGPGSRRHRVMYDDGIYRWE